MEILCRLTKIGIVRSSVPIRVGENYYMVASSLPSTALHSDLNTHWELINYWQRETA